MKEQEFTLYYEGSGMYKASCKMVIKATSKEEAIKKMKEMREDGELDLKISLEEIDFDIF